MNIREWCVKLKYQTLKTGDVQYINSCANEVTTRSRTQIKMVLVGQSKHETISEEKGDIRITRNIKYKLWSKNPSSKRVPRICYRIVQPKLSLLIYNV